MHPKQERTLVIIKPDGVQRSLVGEIIKRVERLGLKIAGLKMLVLDEETLWKHYNKDDVWFEKKGNKILEDRKANGLDVSKPAMEYGKDIIKVLVKYMSAGPVVAFVVQGNQSVAVIKKIVGETEPATSDVGTIRGDFTIDSYLLSTIDDRAVRNLIHCSDSPAEAEREMALWFTPKEIVDYTIVQEKILYDVNLDGIME